MRIKEYLKELYSTDLLKRTFKDRKVLTWIAGGATIYVMPAICRAITKNPILPLPLTDSGNPYIPNNLTEKVLINSFAPDGIGSVVAENYIEKIYGNLKGIKKYLIRFVGSIASTSIWTGLQYLGYNISNYLNLQWPSGGNPFEAPNIYPFNILIALTLAPLSPYLVDFLYERLKKR